MLKDDRRRDYCPVRRVLREEGRTLVLVVVILTAAALLKKLL